jgi:hypothetical protein
VVYFRLLEMLVKLVDCWVPMVFTPVMITSAIRAAI